MPLQIISFAISGMSLFIVSCSNGTKTVSVDAVPDYVEIKKLSHDISKSEMERRITGLVNVERAKKGMRPLASHSGLSDLARDHSVVMAHQAERQRVLLHINHDGFGDRRVMAKSSFGMYSLGENVAANWGYRGDKMEKLVQDWMDSPKHRKNILNSWDAGGVGVYVDSKGAIYATQIFGAGGENLAAMP